MPLSHYGDINKTYNVPQILIDILPQLKLDPVNWINDIKKMLNEKMLTKEEMMDLLKTKTPAKFESSEVLMAFLYFFRGGNECNRIDKFWIRMTGYDVRKEGAYLF